VQGFRASSFGYFGHMWELYAFWAFVPPLAVAYATSTGLTGLNISLLAFAVIAAGAVGCVIGGYLSLRFGSARIAFAQLIASGACCVLSPVVFLTMPPSIFIAFLLFWGVVVVGDSPQFSALNAAYAPSDQVGSALTIANCIGFAISIVSIQLLNQLAGTMPTHLLFLLLIPGPIFGLIALRPLLGAPR
jgi:MFS family permease